MSWPRRSLGLGSVGIEVDDARMWLARVSATILALARHQAGWVAYTPDLTLACALAERVAEDNDHADLLFKRQYGLRAFPQEMVRDSRIVPAWITDLEAAPDPYASLIALYRIIKPRLLVECQRYRRQTAPNADGPTLRQLDLIEPEIEEQIRWGAHIIAVFSENHPDHAVEAAQWAARFEKQLQAKDFLWGATLQSNSDLWKRSGEISTDAPVLRELAATVYTGYDLPWDALLGLARPLGDLARHTQRGALRRPTTLQPSKAPTFPERLQMLAALLEEQTTSTNDAADQFLRAIAQTTALHAREWATRLARASDSREGRPI